MEQPNEATEPTMALLTEDEKALIDDSPDELLKFLFETILRRGIPEYLTFILIPIATGITSTTKIEGTDKVLAVLDYVDYLVAQGIRKDPYE